MDDKWLNLVVDDWELYVLVPFFSEMHIPSEKKHIKLYRYFTLANSMSKLFETTSCKWIQQLVAPVRSRRLFPMGCPTQVTFARTALAGKDSCEIGSWLQNREAAGKNCLPFILVWLMTYEQSYSWEKCKLVKCSSSTILEKATAWQHTSSIIQSHGNPSVSMQQK